jgi:hypothetical protein
VGGIGRKYGMWSICRRFELSTMRYFAACLHGPPGAYKSSIPGYALSPTELSMVAMRAGGAPFTFEHKGVYEAVDIVGASNVTAAAMHAALAGLAKGDAQKAAIGSVLNAFIGADGGLWCVLQLDENRYPRVNQLISMGKLVGVSLTHMPSSMACVEVALTSAPARPDASIRFGSSDLSRVSLYAGDVAAGRLRMASIAEILDEIGGKDLEKRATLEARFVAMNQSAVDARALLEARDAELSTLSSQNAKLVAANTALEADSAIAASSHSSSEYNATVLKNVLADALNYIDPEIRKCYNLTPASVAAVDTKMNSDVHSMAHKVVMCCSAHMMNGAAGATVARGAKREYEEETAAPPMSQLQRAIAKEWNM